MSEEKRAQLLSDSEMCQMLFPATCDMLSAEFKAGDKIRRWYESKIASGELMVVKTAGVELVPNDYDCMLTCTGCRDGAPYYLLEEFDEMNFCPNCGAKIIKP